MQSGRIASWNDAKGFGFIQPDSQAARVFFHISAVQGGRRPVQGETVSFTSERDDKGRLKASLVRLTAVASRSRPTRSARRPGKASGLAQWLGVAAVLLCAFLFLQSTLFSPAGSSADNELQHTLSLIRQGGPYPHAQDDTVFQNRERLLPQQPRGYYREYTVRTPGLSHRGARRVVTGGQPPEVYYYTEDHYRSFRKLEVPR